jgi:hypothetical protein
MLNNLLDKNNILSEVLRDLYTQFDLTKKKGIEKHCFVLNWSKFYVEGIESNSSNILKNELKFDSDKYIDYDIYLKYKTTIDFMKMFDHEKNMKLSHILKRINL